MSRPAGGTYGAYFRALERMASKSFITSYRLPFHCLVPKASWSLAIELEQLFIDGVRFGVRLEDRRFKSGHFLLRGSEHRHSRR